MKKHNLMTEVKDKYDAFLSYNRKDFEQVEQIARWLHEEAKLNIWFDEWNIEAGSWQTQIQSALDNSKCCLIFVGPNGMGIGKYQRLEMDIATSKSVNGDQFKVIPVVLPDEEQSNVEKLLPSILRVFNWVKFETSVDKDQGALISLATAIGGIRRLPPPSPNIGILHGAVLYANIMGYSNFDRIVQEESIEWIIKEIENFATTTNIKWIDLNEGEFLVFILQGDLSRKDTLAKVFLFGLQVQLKSIEEKFNIGVTLHWEGDGNWRKIVRNSYLIGNAFSEAKRYMAFSGKDHFFLSGEAYKNLNIIGSETTKELIDQLQYGINDFNTKWPFFIDINDSFYVTDLKYMFVEFVYFDRHKQKNSLYNFFVESKIVPVGNSTPPNQRVAIEFRDKDRHNVPDQQFVSRLIEADEVSIIGLTHEGTPDFLETALRERAKFGKGFWNKLQIIFPAESSLAKIIEENRTGEQRKNKWLGGRSNVYRFLLGHGQENINKWECLEYSGDLPFVGNKCLIGGIESIRVQFIIPPHDIREIFTIEVFRGTEAFDQISGTLEYITNSCSRVIEWTIYGDMINSKFCFSGLFNRKNLNAVVKNYPGNICFPVVLVMLYSKTGGKYKSILQFRTIYNATSDPNTFSNISGRLIDQDVFSAKNIAVPDHYLRKFYSLAVRYDIDAESTISNEFLEVNNIGYDMILPELTWKEAAIREVHEELGLEISKERLDYQSKYLLERPERGYSLFFKIFSLYIEQSANNNEIETIRQSRPYSNLHPFNLSDLKQMHRERELNALLQRKFTEVFLPIFKKLNIAE